MTENPAAVLAAISTSAVPMDDSAVAATITSEPKEQMAGETPIPAIHTSSFAVLTAAGLATYLHLPESVIRSEAAAGRLPGRCLAGEWRFLLRAITDWLAKSGESSEGVVKSGPVAGAAHDFADDPEAFIASIYAERNTRPVRG